MRIALTDIFRFGIPEIDNEHERIVIMLNEIGDNLMQKNCSSALRQVIHLIAVERKHVINETRLLELYSYQNISSHNAHHSRLRDVLEDIMLAIGDGELEKSQSLHRKLCGTFLDDLLIGDIPFKSLLQKKVVGL